MFSELFGFALGVTSQAFIWVILGVLLYRVGWLPAWLVREASLFVFRLGLPIVLFIGAVKVDYRQLPNLGYLLAPVIATLLIVAGAGLYARLRRFPLQDAAIFVQGAYRSNSGVMGVALAAAAYGDEGVALAALPVAVITILYNAIAVVLLGRAYGDHSSPWRALGGLLTNPLIIGIAAGVTCSVAGWPLNFHVERVGAIFTSGMLPMALVCIGASLNLKTLRESGWLTLEASFWKLLVTPAVTMGVAVALGVHSAELAVLFLLVAAPTAAASYIMVMGAGGNGALAANVVLLSTLLSMVTLTVGLALLQWYGFV
jgi:predicted permease